MKTIGERIRQARGILGWSALDLATRCGYKTQSGISNLENRASGSGGNKIGKIAQVLNVPVDWLINGPDTDNVPFLAPRIPTDPRAAYSTELGDVVSSLKPAESVVEDEWISAAVTIMRELDRGQRQAMVAKMREFRQYLGPPKDGQALSVAG